MSSSGKPELGGVMPENPQSSESAPVYSPGVGYMGEIRGWRTTKFLIGGAITGSILFGLTLGSPLAFRLKEINSVAAGAAVVLSIALGMIIGGAIGLSLEPITWARLRK